MLGDATRTLSIEMLLMIRGQSQTSCEQHHAENETYTLCWTQDIFREYVVHLNRLKLTVMKKGKEKRIGHTSFKEEGIPADLQIKIASNSGSAL